jgi:uncharacterized hydrophobic protein (TIGR00271 family)
MLNNAQFRYQLKKLKEYLALKTDMINYRSVIRDVASGVERSWIYYLMLLSASLIALLGLLTNSVAVVIGAMLISPLMSPIISSGLALTIGDFALARRAFRTIATSVVLTILLTAFITFLSPLNEPTAEILARVRPNIYDLFIAVVSGIVGAVALCTKRNYLITATGVAVATAVIPPLSVAGYGLGTGQLMLGLGGFFLFFTNFVAIVLTSDLVFFIMGFRTTHVETIQYSPRKRILIITVLLTLISIPLIYTLVADLQKVKTKKQIERVLKKHLNRINISRMTGYSYRQGEKLLDITTTVNTVSYIPKTVEQSMEAELRGLLTLPVDLHLEQIIMASDKIAVQHDPSLLDKGKEVQREDTPLMVSAKTVRMVAMAEQALANDLLPFTLADTRLSFASSGQPLQLTATLHRDWPVSQDEQVLLARHLEQILGQPLVVSLKTAPILPPLTFSADGALSAESVQALGIIKKLPGSPDSYRYLLKASGRNNREQLAAVQNHLSRTLQIPAAAVSVTRQRGSKTRTELTLRIVRQ